MKKCPHCEKEVPDYARKCKYCDHAIPVFEPAGGTAPSLMTCPSCGGGLEYDTSSSRAHCPHCGNQVVMTGREIPVKEEKPVEERNLPLSETIEQLVNEGQRERAVTLLRQNLSIQTVDAERVVEIMESGEYGDATRLFQDAMQGRLK